jgi:hypothetical protein
MTAVPDPEALLVAALRAKTQVTGLVSTRIGTSLGATFPQVRVTLTGGSDRLVLNTGRPSLQWEAWGSTEGEAALVAVALDGVADELAGTYAAGRIISSWRQGNYFHSPDANTGRQRYIGQLGILTQS